MNPCIHTSVLRIRGTRARRFFSVHGRASGKQSAWRDFNHNAGSGSCRVHRVGNLLHHGTHQAPSVLAENHDRELAAFQILLIRQICVRREKHLKPSFLSSLQQVAVAQRVPSLRFCLFDDVALQRTGNASGRSVVKENKHQRRTGVSRLRAAKSSTAVTCSRVTSNCSIISSMLMPSSRFSKMVATGSRVPRKTHAPLTFPGTPTTAAHFDQSSAIGAPPFFYSIR